MSEFELRTSAFLTVLLAMLLWERARPVRGAAPNPWRRRLTNVSMALLGAMLVRLVMPASLATAAYFAGRWHVGLFHVISVPTPVVWVSSVLLLDLAVYLQHRVFHRIPALWRLHAVHHADASFDVTTGIRFHPVEILMSLGWKSLIVILLGVPAGAAVLFEFVLSTTALFNHGNVRLPEPAESWLRWLLVTPTLHRVHHSLVPDERERNYGFSVTWWDRLFGTYRGAGRKADPEIGIGLSGMPSACAGSIVEMLMFPLRPPQRP